MTVGGFRRDDLLQVDEQPVLRHGLACPGGSQWSTALEFRQAHDEMPFGNNNLIRVPDDDAPTVGESDFDRLEGAVAQEILNVGRKHDEFILCN